MTAMPSPTDVLLHLDPRELLAESNVRKDLGDLEDLTASVRAMGVLEPVVIAPNGEGADHYRIVFGFRRVAAAAVAGCTVPCVVRPDLIDASKVTAQLVENLRRRDLTAAEEAAGYEQLRAFGLDEVAIAQQTGTAPVAIARGLRVAAAPKTLAVAAKYRLSLDDSAAIAEFEDDSATIKALTVTLQKDPERFRHVLSRARQERRDREAREEIVRNLGDVPLCEKSPQWSIVRGYPTKLSELRTAEGKKITPAKHRKCPGHAGYIDERYGNEPKLVWVCTDPLKHGHDDQHGGAKRMGKAATDDLTPQAAAAVKEEASAARKEVIGNNKAWRAADPVRKAFLEELFARKPAAVKGALRYAVAAVLLDRRLLAEHGEHRYDAGAARKALDAPDAALPVVLMRAVCEAMEASLGASFGMGGGWRNPATGTAAYLEFLAANGYPLSEVEQVAVAASKKDRR